MSKPNGITPGKLVDHTECYREFITLKAELSAAREEIARLRSVLISGEYTAELPQQNGYFPPQNEF